MTGPLPKISAPATSEELRLRAIVAGNGSVGFHHQEGAIERSSARWRLERILLERKERGSN